MQTFDAYIDAHRQVFLAELEALLRIPSVAAQGTGLHEAAGLVRRQLERLGARVHTFELDGGAPLVYATLGSGPRRLLIYDHYDVQPAEPLAAWTSPAFEPTIRGGKLFARGVADNKGNLMLRLQALAAWQATQGPLPFQVVFVIEGEEETDSRTLPAFAQAHADLLRADGCLWETGRRDISERPLITCGVKGIQYVELVARGAAYDQHSSLASVVPNPAWRLTWALATLKDTHERVLLPGFYDAVRPPTPADLAALESIPDTDEATLADLGLDAFLGGVHGTARMQRLLFTPTCTICGLVSGYTGEGGKTVLPSEARAKLDFRLVPDMQPQDVLTQLRAHLDEHGFSDIEIRDLGGDFPARSDLNAPVVQAMIAATTHTYGAPPVLYPTMAGSGPMYHLGPLHGTPVTDGVGCSYAGAQIHAPNEHIRLDDYWLGMRCMGRFVKAFANSSA